MNYRLMVRSAQGSRIVQDTAGAYWEPIYVWSTWDEFDDEQRAFDAKLDFMNGGVAATVILQSEYDRFCLTHKIS
jgi:hypothetical protein